MPQCPMTDATQRPLDDYTLADCYARQSGRVFLTGTQALVRLALAQAAIDRRDGRHTAGFVTGYRGSPLGGFDQALWSASDQLAAAGVDFMPAINEELAATAIIGTQQVEGDPARQVDGVFAIWYGKGPGVDRAGDALKHGNAYGSSPNGGVLVVAGDDHGCVSSSMSHQSDVAFMSWFMPTLHPASVAEYERFGLWGFALSRFSGCWVGFKAISETVESARSVELEALPVFRDPPDHARSAGGALHYRWPDYPGPQIEARMVDKVEAMRAFARANPIDRRIYDIPDARFGIVTTGKAHLDLMEALALLGIDEARARRIGIDIYKVGMVWPLETEGARAFLRGKEEVLVIEEKRGIIESELKEFLYDYPGDKPRRMVGKYDEDGAPLVPWTGELSPMLLAPIVAARIRREFPHIDLSDRLAALAAAPAIVEAVDGARRLPYFCAGCPHNRSTVVPEGSEALAGIGCHFMASWMNRHTSSLIQMGGEGVAWIGKSRFTGNGHVFQNLGEGTWFHSGSLAIRQAVAAGANITYKILFNDAVAMTGGQPVDGRITVHGLANQLHAEGVRNIVVVSPEPTAHRRDLFPRGVDFRHRDDLDAIQRELREIPGVTALIYDHACATETRRKRKRGLLPAPDTRLLINEAVCEGCGDCGAQSNCLAIHPADTEFGRKRRIDQGACNSDLSCLEGFCPSFVSVTGARVRRTSVPVEPFAERLAALEQPLPLPLSGVHGLLIAGVGGTGVVTVGALVAMAAHLEGKGVSVLDFTGFAQKGGSVLSYVRVARSPPEIHPVRIDHGAADAVIACDLLVATDPRALAVLGRERTRVLANSFETPGGDFVLSPDADMAIPERIARLRDAVGATRVGVLDATRLAERLCGDGVLANVLMLGCAWQLGMVPVSGEALDRAITLNGTAVAANRRAFGWGRLVAVDPHWVLAQAGMDERPARATSLETLIRRRRDELIRYQDARWAARYVDLVERVRLAEATECASEDLTRSVAENLFRLMSYKDEYEVARLYSEPAFAAQLAVSFEGDYRIALNLAPPFLPARRDARGYPRKRAFGAWMLPVFRLLRHGKRLRGRWLDPFARQEDRKLERALIDEYLELIEEVLAGLEPERHALAREILDLPAIVRGFGPVKATAVQRMRARRDKLLARWTER